MELTERIARIGWGTAQCDAYLGSEDGLPKGWELQEAQQCIAKARWIYTMPSGTQQTLCHHHMERYLPSNIAITFSGEIMEGETKPTEFTVPQYPNLGTLTDSDVVYYDVYSCGYNIPATPSQDGLTALQVVGATWSLIGMELFVEWDGVHDARRHKISEGAA